MDAKEYALEQARLARLEPHEKWTTARPMKAGFYWAKPKGDPSFVVFVTNDLEVMMPGQFDYEPMENISHWMGPLEEPNDPTDGPQ